ncbi:MAG: hypothetical protein Q8M94_08300, partial [Ignavibacteria bacterium]|nr:hypothetical protein [Ignavibacteria bacterium]
HIVMPWGFFVSRYYPESFRIGLNLSCKLKFYAVNSPTFQGGVNEFSNNNWALAQIRLKLWTKVHDFILINPTPP